MSNLRARHTCLLAFAFSVNVLSCVTQAHAAATVQDDTSALRSEFRSDIADGPFGLRTSVMPQSPLQTKWRNVERAIDSESSIIAQCRANPDDCASPAAARFLKIVNVAAVREGLARLGEINRAFNLAIRPVNDLVQYGVDDYWSSPLATLAAGAGDCEDYAIAKLVALREAGVAPEDAHLIILREIITGEDHAVVAARAEGRWYLLDNRTFVMVEDSEPSKYRPLFAMNADGAKRFDPPEQPMIAAAEMPANDQSSRPAIIEAPDATAPVKPSTIAPDIGNASGFVN